MSKFDAIRRHLPLKFYITFDTDGGSECSPMQVAVGDTYGELPVPTKSHCRFTGWHLGSSSGTEVDSSMEVDFYDTVLYASWQEALNIIWDGTTNGGTAVENPPDYFEDEPFGQFPTSPSKSGYVFVGWFTSPSGKEQLTEETIATSEMGHLYARYIDFSNSTTFEIQVSQMSYNKAGIYTATRKSADEVVAIDWGDGKCQCIDGDIAQVVHEYTSIGTYILKVHDNIVDIAMNTNTTTWVMTTTHLYYNLKKILSWSTSITSLPVNAFYYCGSMTDAIVPSIESLPARAFAYCNSLSSPLNMPEGLTAINVQAFIQCYSLREVTIPSTVTLIRTAFQYCTALSTIYCNRLSAPTASGAFGTTALNWTGRDTYSTGMNKLVVSVSSTGYGARYWSDPLQNFEKCGFNVSCYDGLPADITFDAETNGGHMPDGWDNAGKVYYQNAEYMFLPTPNHSQWSTRFIGWYDDGQLVSSTTRVPEEGATLVAQYYDLSSSLTHMWMFDHGSTEDYVGDINAELSGTADLSSDGAHCYGGSQNASFIDLSPNHLNILPNGEFTIVIGCQLTESSQWQRIFDFGNSNTQYVMASQSGTLSKYHFSAKWGTTEWLQEPALSIIFGEDRMYATTAYCQTGKSSYTFEFYVFNRNGQQLGKYNIDSFNINMPSPLDLSAFYLGRSFYTADSAAKAIYNKCAIFDKRLSASELSDVCTNLIYPMSCDVTFNAGRGYFESSLSGDVRYVKLVVDSIRSGDILQISRLELVKNDGTNYDWPTSTLTSYNAGYTLNFPTNQSIDKVLDHSVDTKMCPNNLTAFPIEFIFDVGEENAIPLSDLSCWQWWTADDTATWAGRNLNTFKLQFSSDGNDYVTVDSVTNYTAPTQNKVLAYQGNISLERQSYIVSAYERWSTFGELPVPSVPTSALQFIGWYTDAVSGDEYLSSSTVPGISALSLYARYDGEIPDVRVQHICTRNCEFDTGYYPTHNTMIRFAATPFGVTGGHIVGTGSSTSDANDWRVFNYSSQIYFDLKASRIVGSSWSANTKRHLECGNNYVKDLSSGTTLLSSSSIASYSSNDTLRIGMPSESIGIQFEYVQIYENGVLVKDFIPIDDSETSCLLDLVSGQKLYATGSGTLSVGDEIVQIEYLEFNGTQFIDTGFTATGGCIMECRYYVEPNLTGGENNTLMGSHNPSGQSSNQYNRNEIKPLSPTEVQFNKCDKFEHLAVSNLGGAWHTFYFDNIGNKRLGKIDGNTIVDQTTTYTLNPVNTILIGGSQYNYGPGLPSGKIAWAKIQNANRDLVRDFIPVRLGQTGCLYDKVTKQLFMNAGSGQFSYGNDVEGIVA